MSKSLYNHDCNSCQLNGYCKECDKHIDFNKDTIEVTNPDKYYKVNILLVCPSCGQKELITKMDVN